LHDKKSFLRCKVSLKNLIYHLKVKEKQGNTRKRSHIDTPKYKKTGEQSHDSLLSPAQLKATCNYLLFFEGDVILQ